MPLQEQLHKRQRRHQDELVEGTFPEANTTVRPHGDPEGIDDLMERIDAELKELVHRALGRSTGIETA